MQEEPCILTERGKKTGAHGGSIQRSHVAPVFVAKQVIAKLIALLSVAQMLHTSAGRSHWIRFAAVHKAPKDGA